LERNALTGFLRRLLLLFTRLLIPHGWTMEGPRFEFSELGRSGVPGVVHVLGPYARALITTPPPHCDAIAAAAEIGAGRLVAVSHEGYISHAQNVLNGAAFWSAIVSWAGHAREGEPVRVGVHGKDVAWLTKVIATINLQARFVAVPAQDPSCQVVLWMGTTGSGNVVPKEADIRATEFAWFLPFLERGGGLIVSMCPWGFEQVSSLMSIELQ
jgi:hypothetical protein